MGQYDEEMRKGNKTIIRDYYGGVDKAIKGHNLTFSGWLQFVRKLPEEEISDLYDNHKRNDELQKEYESWIKDSSKE